MLCSQLAFNEKHLWGIIRIISKMLSKGKIQLTVPNVLFTAGLVVFLSQQQKFQQVPSTFI